MWGSRKTWHGRPCDAHVKPREMWQAVTGSHMWKCENSISCKKYEIRNTNGCHACSAINSNVGLRSCEAAPMWECVRPFEIRDAKSEMRENVEMWRLHVKRDTVADVGIWETARIFATTVTKETLFLPDIHNKLKQRNEEQRCECLKQCMFEGGEKMTEAKNIEVKNK